MTARSGAPYVAVLILMGLGATTSHASDWQRAPYRLPATDDVDEVIPEGRTSYGRVGTGNLEAIPAATPLLTEPVEVPGEGIAELEVTPLTKPPGKDGILQNAWNGLTWLPGLGDEPLGFTSIALSQSLGFPMPTRESPLLVTPFFEVHFVDGPSAAGAPDLPPRLYDTEVEFRWIRPLGDRWTADLAVAPGMHTDFQLNDGDAFRLTGRALGIYKWDERLTLVMGVLYLNRIDIMLMPAGGLIWLPNDDWRLELLVPKPRIARRFYHASDETGRNHDVWAYVAGEFGGGVWAIERANGEPDLVTARDYRLLLGTETKHSGGVSGRFEIGYVFGRQLEFESNTPDYEPSSTFLIRSTSTY